MTTGEQLNITRDNGASHIVCSSHFCYESCATVGMHFQRGDSQHITSLSQLSANYTFKLINDH